MSELLLQTINETLKKLVADRAVAESRLSDARTDQQHAQNAVDSAREDSERARFARDQVRKKHSELLNHLRARKDTPQPLWERLTALGEELRTLEALIVPAYDECLRREKELEARVSAVAFAEMKFKQVTERATQVAEELKYATPF